MHPFTTPKVKIEKISRKKSVTQITKERVARREGHTKKADPVKVVGTARHRRQRLNLQTNAIMHKKNVELTKIKCTSHRLIP